MRDYLDIVVSLYLATAPYLVVGFLLAGLIQVLLPERWVERHLGPDRFRSVAIAAAAGIPLPLCSCSVLPTAAALRQSGASKGATTAFLISTPETGVDSIGVTWALLDPLMTVLRPVGALLGALLTGSLVNGLVRAGWDGSRTSPAADPTTAPVEDACACGPGCEAGATAPARGVVPTVVRGARYGFGRLLDDLTPWLVLGFLLSGAFAMLLPEGFFEHTFPTGWPAYLLMLVAGIPLYVCAVAATPLAAVLIAKGLDPGAALVLLLAGPATNVATILVVTRVLGRRVAVVYVLGVAASALLLGAVAGAIYRSPALDIASVAAASLRRESSPVRLAAALLLLVLLLASGVRLVRARWRVLRRGGTALLLLPLVLLPAVLGLASCGSAPDGRRLRVVVSVAPDAWLVREVAGDDVEVVTLAEPGDDPHTYQPTDAQVSAALGARIFFRTGVPFENGAWTRALRERPGIEIVDLRQGLVLRRVGGAEAAGSDGRGHGDEEMDPHVWLAPKLLETEAHTVAAALDRVDPDGAAARAANLSRLVERLRATDAEVSRILSPYRGRRVYVFHPAFGYLLDAYGLVQVAIEDEGKEPSEADLTARIRQAREDGVRAVFVQSQVQGRAAKALAGALGVKVLYLDPLAPDVTGNLVVIARALATSFD